MPFRFWSGEAFPFIVGTSGGSIATEDSANYTFNSLIYEDGDKIVRTLVGYRWDTRLIENSLLTDEHPQALAMSVIYVPSPDSEGSAFDIIGGDKLWFGHSGWRRYAWTDGTTFSTGWEADSGEWHDIKADRIIQDKTTGFIQVGVSIDPFNGFFGHSTAAFTAEGWMGIRFLIERT